MSLISGWAIIHYLTHFLHLSRITAAQQAPVISLPHNC